MLTTATPQPTVSSPLLSAEVRRNNDTKADQRASRGASWVAPQAGTKPRRHSGDAK